MGSSLRVPSLRSGTSGAFRIEAESRDSWTAEGLGGGTKESVSTDTLP